VEYLRVPPPFVQVERVSHGRQDRANKVVATLVQPGHFTSHTVILCGKLKGKGDKGGCL
jgi:hypothetical protein